MTQRCQHQAHFLIALPGPPIPSQHSKTEGHNNCIHVHSCHAPDDKSGFDQTVTSYRAEAGQGRAGDGEGGGGDRPEEAWMMGFSVAPSCCIRLGR